MYKDYITKGMTVAYQASATILNHYVQKQGSAATHLQASVDSITNIAAGQTIAVVLFNNLGWSRQDVVVIPVNRPDLLVLDSMGKTIVSQISSTLGPNVASKYELFFTASVGPLGFATYFVRAPATESYSRATEVTIPQIPSADTVFENDVIKVTISGTSGLVSNIANKKSGVSLDVNQNLQAYTSQRSGAYAFKPTGPPRNISAGAPRTVVTQGPVVSEIHQTFSNYAKQTIRVFTSNTSQSAQQYLEINLDLGALPSHTEVVATFSTPLNTQRTITSDDNGFEFLTRKYDSSLGIEANYYPMIYASYINDASSQLTVVSERSHGTGSSSNGELEVMVHRNPDMGDGFGPGLTDTSEVYPVLRVVVDSPSGSHGPLHRQPYLINFPLSVFTDVAKSASDWSSSYVTEYNLLKAELPASIHFLSLNALDASSKGVILRLTHLFATGEDPVLSNPVTIDFTKLFSGVTVTKVQETTLSANKNLGTPSLSPVTISPKEIRTFVIEFGN
jgi:hypothetical protein